MAALVVLVASLMGAVVGSYLGVATSRGWRRSLGGRSHCDTCHSTLRWYELVPLVSFPLLHGHCRTCRARIGWATYLWELGGAAVVAAVAAFYLIVSAGATG